MQFNEYFEPNYIKLTLPQLTRIYIYTYDQPRGLVVRVSLTTNHEDPGSIPGSTMGIFPCRERFPW